MADWRCEACGAINLSGQRACEACGKLAPDRPGPTVNHSWQSPEWMQQPPPCSPEETYRAAQLVKAVLAREITVEQGQQTLRAIFSGREVSV